MDRRSPGAQQLWPIVFLLFGLTIVKGSNLALLSGTLRTIQKHACDDELLSLKCPHGTTISVQLAQYGRQTPSYLLCPPTTTDDTYFTENDNTSCLAESSLQYYLLQAVVEACQEKKTCRLQTSPQTFGSDPCPGIRKYVEVAFKCRPSEFRSKVICEGDQLHLRCHRATRIAIYSASFGRTHHGSIECPQPEGVPDEDCQASYGTETVMRICHGRRRCSMKADMETFGNPCEEVTRKYLRVVYTCVNKKILKDMYNDEYESDAEGESKEEDDEVLEEPTYDPSSSQEFDQRNRPVEKSTKDSKRKPDLTLIISTSSTSVRSSSTTARPPVPSATGVMEAEEETRELEGIEAEDGFVTNCTYPEESSEETNRVIGFIREWITAYTFLRDNFEKLLLYLVLSVGAGLLGFLLLVVGKLLLAKRRERRRAQLNISEPLPDSFGDELSDIDQDISDLTQNGRQEASVEVVRYTSRSTMRRQDSDTNPRAPISRNQNNYYYS